MCEAWCLPPRMSKRRILEPQCLRAHVGIMSQSAGPDSDSVPCAFEDRSNNQNGHDHHYLPAALNGFNAGRVTGTWSNAPFTRPSLLVGPMRHPMFADMRVSCNLTSGFRATGTLGAVSLDAGRDGFGLAADSATNVPTETGPQGRFFVVRNPASLRDFAPFCGCHAAPECGPKQPEFDPPLLSLLHFPSPTRRSWHPQNS